MKRFLSFLTSLDNLAPQLNLTYRKESRMKTAFGGAVVMAIYIIISLGLFYFSRDIIYRTNPITKVNKAFRDDITMPASMFPLNFMVADRFIRPITPGDALWESIEISIEYWISVVNSEGANSTKFNIYKTMPCNKEYFKGYEEFYAISVHPASLCVDYSKSYDYFGKEAEDESIYFEKSTNGSTNHLNVKVKACDEAKKPGCRKALDEMGQLNFFMGFPTAIVNFDDFDHPVTNSLDFFQSSISPGLFSRKFATMSVNEFISDNGLILTDTMSETYIQTKMTDTHVLKYSESSRALFAFSFRLELIKETMERRYVKVQEILANVGGFMKAILMFATLLVKYFSEYSFFTSFGKEMSIISRRLNQPVSINNLVSESKNESKVQIESALNKATIKTDLGFYAFISGIFFKKRSLAAKEREKVFRYLDIAFISGKLIEFEDNLNRIRR